MTNLEKDEISLKAINECIDQLDKIKSFYTYDIKRVKKRIEESIKVSKCKHEITRDEESWDSHHSYEDKICVLCGTTVESIKV